MKRIVCGAVAAAASALAACALATPAALASSGQIVGRLMGLPASTQFAFVRAVNASGVIVATTQADGTGSYTLRVNPGVYVVIGDAATAGGHVLEATGVPVRVRAGRSSHDKTPVRSDRFAKGHPAAVDPSQLFTHAAAIASRPLPRKAVVTVVSPTLVNNNNFDPPLAEGPDRTEIIANHFVSTCSARGVIVVDTSPEFLKFAQQEAALQRAGMLSPQTPFRFQPIKPQYQIGAGSFIPKNESGFLPTYSIDISIDKLPLGQVGGTLGVDDSSFTNGGEPIDDSFINTTLSTQTEALAAQACP